MRVISVVIRAFVILTCHIISLMVAVYLVGKLMGTSKIFPFANFKNTIRNEILVDIKKDLRQTEKNIKETAVNNVEIQKIIKEMEEELKIYENQQ